MRKAGILMHPSSLPGPGPCGDLGEGATAFLDWMRQAGLSLWQTLPLHPTGGGFSPYSSPSAFAGATYLVSLDKLRRDGLLSQEVLHCCWNEMLCMVLAPNGHQLGRGGCSP